MERDKEKEQDGLLMDKVKDRIMGIARKVFVGQVAKAEPSKTMPGIPASDGFPAGAPMQTESLPIGKGSPVSPPASMDLQQSSVPEFSFQRLLPDPTTLPPEDPAPSATQEEPPATSMPVLPPQPEDPSVDPPVLAQGPSPRPLSSPRFTRPPDAQAPAIPTPEESVLDEKRIAKAQRIYDEALAAAKELDEEDLLRTARQVKADIFFDLSRRIRELFLGNDYSLMRLAAQPGGFDHNRHVVDAAILAICLDCFARGSSTDEPDILGASAFMQNLGMAVCRGIIYNARVLSEFERGMLRKHPAAGAEIVEKMEGLAPALRGEISRTIRETHERIDGNGYPAKLSGAAISPRAQLLAVADVYQALTHERPWRKAFSPPEALRTILELKEQGFSDDIRRILVKTLTIYPFGTRVRLSTGEEAEVVEPNRDSVMRPKVRLLEGGEGAKGGNVVLDLALNKFVSVADVLDASEGPSPH